MAKEFLKVQKVEFEDVDVENDEEAVKEMVQKSGRTALPVIDIDGQIIVGFDKVAIVKALRK
jgi:glutaredoxin 3